MKKAILVIGTRPEAVKLAPLVPALRRVGWRPAVVLTGQHGEIIRPFLRAFGLRPVAALDVGRRAVGPNRVLAAALEGLEDVLRREQPACVLVQGDTTSALAGALTGFHLGIPVAHVEAGLRTGDLRAPFPEEANRRLIAQVASFHFAPTAGAARNLRREGVPPSAIHVVGNTVVDALRTILGRARPRPAGDGRILVTMHRRESWDGDLARVAEALSRLADAGRKIVFPVHPAPAVRAAASRLAGHPRVRLLPPLPYRRFLGEMLRADLVLTDSGGVQEEAATLGIPYLVLRRATERPEGLRGGGRIVGTDPEEILRAVAAVRRRDRRRGARWVFGDGRAAQRIASVLARCH